MCICAGVLEVGAVALVASASAYYKKCKCKKKKDELRKMSERSKSIEGKSSTSDKDLC